MKRFAIATMLAAVAPPVLAHDWNGFYVGVFGGVTRVEGSHPRWPNIPVLGFVDGNIPLFGPSASGAGIDWTAWSPGQASSSEVGLALGHNWQSGSLVAGVETSVSVEAGHSARGVGYGMTNSPQGFFFSQTGSGWLGGFSAELAGRIGVLATDDMILFGTIGVAADNRTFSTDRTAVGPGTVNWGAWLPTYTPDPGAQATMRVDREVPFLIKPTFGVGSEVALTDTVRIRADYQVRYTPAHSVTLHVDRQTTDPVVLPVASDTIPMSINDYFTHSVRVGITFAF